MSAMEEWKCDENRLKFQWSEVKLNVVVGNLNRVKQNERFVKRTIMWSLNGRKWSVIGWTIVKCSEVEWSEVG